MKRRERKAAKEAAENDANDGPLFEASDARRRTMAEPSEPPNSSEIVFYQGEDGLSRIQVRLEGGTVWLTQRLLAELYQETVSTINEHLKNIYADEELDPAATIRKLRIVQVERKR